ncbi:hypothetical protein BBK36DRAFT_1163367 [Trichoderma citrinoviride]|uniref:Uncharacterized protein n=1 Tax=Trichoderma citrinoviride TaxID=58853 RepID=A0A2T4AY82_9HYPO|nr:hypothetical protein BBK36DRAFT_1163367 [Trichoderma citrinoviride]PTB62034.1 hypothetical protein BBK36DRAFT_1163367 [Trichoderma citrinoviride]
MPACDLRLLPPPLVGARGRTGSGAGGGARGRGQGRDQGPDPGQFDVVAAVIACRLAGATSMARAKHSAKNIVSPPKIVAIEATYWSHRGSLPGAPAKMTVIVIVGIVGIVIVIVIVVVVVSVIVVIVVAVAVAVASDRGERWREENQN